MNMQTMMSTAGTITAIPTKYRGVQFRSRLEAKWAAFFDLAGWPYEYEQLDLDGYIPDFILDLHRPLLVEIKPALHLGELMDHASKIERAGWTGEALLVGASLFETGAENPILGMLGERTDSPDGTGLDWGHGRLFTCACCERVSLLHCRGGWNCRVCGHAEGNGHILGAKGREMWVQAGNAVQWRPVR